MDKITPKELSVKLLTEKSLVLDVRAKEKFETNPISHKNIENIHIPKENILNDGKSSDFPLPNDQEIIVTCTTGNSASKCATILADKGYNVTLLEGGITAWDTYQNNKKADR